MGDILHNHHKGINTIPYCGKDLTHFLREENIASLSNFIRYGEYSNGRKHGSLAKNKSIADILMLTDAECIILINFIEICRLNKEIIYGKIEDFDENLFNKLLISVQNSPSNLPMFYKDNCIDETVFYYRLIKDLLKWVIMYQQFCKMNGVNMLYTVGIIDVTIFNGKLNELSEKMSTYLMKVRAVYPFETLEPNKKPLPSREDCNHHINKDGIIEEISREILKKLNIVNEHREDCNAVHNQGRNMFKYKYPFEESGFKEPTLIKKNSVVYTDDVCNLVKRMEDNDILFIPNNDDCEEKDLIFENLKNITIVGKSNIPLDYTFQFRDCTCLMHNISLKANESTIEDRAVLCDENVDMRIEDCIFDGFVLGVQYTNHDPFSEYKNLYIKDSVFLNCESAISTESVNELKLFDCIFTDCFNAVYIEHNLHSKGFIDINSCDFINCLSEEGAIRAINYSTSSRVGIEEVRIQHSRFIANSIDILIGKSEEKLTDVVIHTRDNLGLTTIKNLVADYNTSDEEDNKKEIPLIIDNKPNKIPTKNEDDSIEE